VPPRRQFLTVQINLIVHQQRQQRTHAPDRFPGGMDGVVLIGG